MDIGIIGLGAMGREIAPNLAAAGHTVKAWNRSGGNVAGVRMVDTPLQARQADIALTMLSDDAAIRSVLLESAALEQVRPVFEGRTLPMLDAVRHQMAAAVDAGGGDRDWSVVADYTIRSAG